MEKIKEKIILSAPKNTLKRRLFEISSLRGGKLIYKGREYINFSSNDYLAISEHPEVINAARDVLLNGVGATSSRLMTGSTSYHHLLEAELAEFKQKPAALVFNSGYQANLGIISALIGPGDCVFSDRLVHASIVDGIKLSGARCFRFRHNDMEHLEELVKNNRQRFRTALIVTESVFSMDGDEAPLGDIVRIKGLYDCLIMIDEAHATGIFGERGSGMASEKGFSSEIDVIMGTFSKALGVFGAYAAFNDKIKGTLVNKCRSFIYSTALPAPVIASCIAALRICEKEPWRREGLLSKVSYARNLLSVDTIPGRSQIIPLLVGDENKAVFFSETLRERGWWVTAVRPPTVPAGGSRLRVSITFHHDNDTLDRFISDVTDVFQNGGYR